MLSNKLNALYGTLTVAVLGTAVLTGATLAVANENAHWGYSYENGPSKWAKMSEKFRTCGTGKHQSPINIEGKTVAGSIDVAFSYKAGPATVTNNGHTIQVNVAKGNSVKIDGKPYDWSSFTSIHRARIHSTGSISRWRHTSCTRMQKVSWPLSP